ncbi:class I SAM-dependent methyltransferase [Melittangium boletus]|uniref:Methyltransferase type 12 domain-containing protein n=1 Tax=Melittangium boletus DSM 14713 TaxID=1294270 RepID=A0A286NVI5_9BACT|nr:class I SAM-dependent methyltransferase [Melittangium boletus]ATB27176.1 hypothetical protein MEBOL_000614 [Melittangium boletus DSM 14713]
MHPHHHPPPHDHQHPHQDGSTRKFGAERAAQYDAQAASWFIGVHAMHDAIATVMSATLDGQDEASLLCVGVGTGQDVLPYAKQGAPGWRFTGVDPSPDMLAVARKQLAAAGLLERTQLHVGELDSLPPGPLFDGAEMIGVLHHVAGEENRLALLREVARRLKPGAPFILGCRIGLDPVLTAVEAHRFQRAGAPPEFSANFAKGLASLQAPESEAALAALLGRAGWEPPRQIFAALQFRVYLTRSAP